MSDMGRGVEVTKCWGREGKNYYFRSDVLFELPQGNPE